MTATKERNHVSQSSLELSISKEILERKNLIPSPYDAIVKGEEIIF